MTRQDRVCRDVPEAMELTEDAIDAMPRAQPKDVEKIAAEVARRMQLVPGGPTRTPSLLIQDRNTPLRGTFTPFE